MRITYKINPDVDVPIYQQLVDMIENEIKKGELIYGEKLPTVQEMMADLGIARGTVKRAYDELERRGFVEKAQGRGTFVSYHPSSSGSRKEQAIAAIDHLFAELEEMGFSPTEINIFLNLKLRERTEQEALVKVAIIECNHENVSNLADQLRHIPGVDPYAYTIDNVRQYPYKLGDDFDLVVTTPTHAEELDRLLPESKKTVQVALRPSPRFLSNIIRLSNGKHVGILVYSERFGRLIHDTCLSYTEDIVLSKPIIVSSHLIAKDYLDSLDVILVPKRFKKFFPSTVSDAVASFQGDIIEAYYEMDEGSVMYLERKTKKLLDKKNI